MPQRKLVRPEAELRLRKQCDQVGWALWEIARDDEARAANPEGWLVELEKRAIAYSVAHRILREFNEKHRAEREYRRG